MYICNDDLAKMLLMCAKAHLDNVDFIAFTEILDIEVFTAIEIKNDNERIFRVYADFIDTDNSIMRASFYFRVTVCSVTHKIADKFERFNDLEIEYMCRCDEH